MHLCSSLQARVARRNFACSYCMLHGDTLAHSRNSYRSWYQNRSLHLQVLLKIYHRFSQQCATAPHLISAADHQSNTTMSPIRPPTGIPRSLCLLSTCFLLVSVSNGTSNCHGQHDQVIRWDACQTPGQVVCKLDSNELFT